MKSAFFQGFSLRKATGHLFYAASRLLCLGLAKVLFRLRVEGAEFIPWTGSAILAANHISYIDPIIIGIVIRRHIHFMAKEELFRFPPFGWVLRHVQAFPVNRRRIDIQAMKRAIFLLGEGEVLLIFPEGKRGDGSRLGPAKPGIGLIAARSGAPVIPVLHEGTEKALPRGGWFPKPCRITVRFGEPLRFPEAQVGEWQEQVADFSERVMERIAALKARSQGGRGVSNDRAHVAGNDMRTESRGIKGQRG